MLASKVAVTKTGFSWNRVEDVFINFYDASVNVGFYSERPFVSPIANGAMLSYKYKYLGTFYDGEGTKPIHKIKVIPRRKGDPLFNGEIYISEENYQIYSSDFYITKDAQIEFADTVHIKQEMVRVEFIDPGIKVIKPGFHIASGDYIFVNEPDLIKFKKDVDEFFEFALKKD